MLFWVILGSILVGIGTGSVCIGLGVCLLTIAAA